MEFSITLIILGVLAAASVIIKKKPEAKALIDFLVPFQGWIGFVCFFWGAWGVIGSVRTIAGLASNPLLWGMGLAAASLLIGLGLLLGFALISKYVLSKNDAAMQKGEMLRAKLANYQIPLGFIAIILGLIYTVLLVLG